MSGLRSIAERHFRAFNERAFDAWIDLFHEDIEITVDAGHLRGVEAAKAYAAGTLQAYPGVVSDHHRVVAESENAIVVDFRLVNADADASHGGWYLGGVATEILEVRDGRIVSLRSYYLPTDEDRTDVVAVPSRAEAARIATEQAALRRVATLVARGVLQDELFAAVNEEIAGLVGADTTALMRFEPGDMVTLVAAWGAEHFDFPIGERRPADAPLRKVRESGGPVRYEEIPDSAPFVEEARRFGVRSAVGVPIVIEGRVWGASFAATSGAELFPPDTDDRIAGFAELVATAIANAQAQSELRELVDQQVARRRVAELVAGGEEPDDVFEAVAREVSTLMGGAATMLLRYDHPDGATVVGVHGSAIEVGTGTSAEDGLTARVRRAGRPVRIDDFEALAGAAPARAREMGIRAAAGAPIVVAGRLWGLIVVTAPGELPPSTEDRLAQFAELVAASIANTESRRELTASRARVVATANETRRRIQRDVHDGAQQRLVGTVVSLKLLRQALGGSGGEARVLVDEALEQAEQANAELRELVRGIMPAALTRGGLRAGVESLVRHVELPVHADITPARLPSDLETTAYFVVAEALTNAVKHAGATEAQVLAAEDEGALRVEVRDDGAGGADPARGTGLVGLTDRVAAAGGSIAITSPPGEGTTLAVRLPIEASDEAGLSATGVAGDSPANRR